MSCSSKFHNLVTYVLKIFFLALSEFLFNSSLSFLLFFLLSSVLTFFHFLLSSILLIIYCVIHGFLALFSTLPTRSLKVPNTHSFIWFHCTSTFPLLQLIAMTFSSRLSSLCHWAYNFSKSHLGLLFWNLIIFFNLVQILATSKLWSESISAPGSVCTSFTLFLKSMLHKYVVQMMVTLISWCLPCVRLLLGFLYHVFMTISPFVSQMLLSIWTLWFFLPRPCGPTIFLYDSPPSTLHTTSLYALMLACTLASTKYLSGLPVI